ETWLDWADALERRLPEDAADDLAFDAGEAAILAGGPAAYARRLALWGLDQGVLATRAEAVEFRDALFASPPSGAGAPAMARAAPQTTEPVDLAAIEFDRRIGDHLAAARRAIAAPEALAAVETRLQAVMDAVLRCEGDPAACADVAHNPSLARAARQ